MTEVRSLDCCVLPEVKFPTNIFTENVGAKGLLTFPLVMRHNKPHVTQSTL
jgi:hypothetical protein